MRIVCIHCGYPLEPIKGDGLESCRFCVKAYRQRCVACEVGRQHQQSA